MVQRLNMWLNTRYRFVAGLVAGLGNQKTLFATVQEICQHPLAKCYTSNLMLLVYGIHRRVLCHCERSLACAGVS